MKSHPSWVCGLKLCICLILIIARSHTLRGCVDWNFECSEHNRKNRQSHPSWVCGLKHLISLISVRFTKSHPSWVCGLKPDILRLLVKRCLVTPFVGVWIETCRWPTWCYSSWVTPFVGVWIETLIDLENSNLPMSHPSWVCGLKLYNSPNLSIFPLRHTLRGCVDWNC